MYSKIKQFLDAAPTALKSANEIYNFARNKYKQVMGVFPDGLDDVFLKRGSAEMQDVRQKVVKFPEGGKDKTDFFTTRPDPRVKQPKGAKMDVQRAHENLAGGSNYAQGDTKYNADVLADEIARQRKLIPDDGIADSSDLDFKTKTALYDEAYSYLTGLRMLNRKPKQGGLMSTIEGETKMRSPEEIMEFLMKGGKGADTNIGKAPKTKKTKPDVDPVLQQSEDQKQMFLDFGERNKTRPGKINYDKMGEFLGVKLRGDETFDELLEIEKNLNKPKKAQGGRIGFSGGGAGFAGNQMEGKIYTRSEMENDTYVKNDMPEYVMSDTPGSPRVPMGQMGPANVGIFGGGGYSKNQIVPGVDMATTNQNYGITGQIPIGNTGFTIGGDYMKSRANERFTGEAIPGQTFKNVPTDSDRFNVGINFRKQFKEGSKPKNPGRRTFLKGMAGLAALPFVGKFFKPAAKVAETAGPAIAEGVKLGFDKFVMLVNKIKNLGKKTDKVTQKEREVGYTYEGKDGSQYELVEDLGTGDIRVTKDKPGFAMSGDESFDTIEDRSTFVLKRNQADETTKGRKPPDEYDEVKEVPSRDGTFDDIDEVDDNTVREILEELGETRTKKASGGLAYMLGE